MLSLAEMNVRFFVYLQIVMVKCNPVYTFFFHMDILTYLHTFENFLLFSIIVCVTLGQ